MVPAVDDALTRGRRTALEPGSFPYYDPRRFTFSLGIEAEGAVWLSGHTAVRVDPCSQRATVEGDIVEQTRTIYQKIRTILEAAELDLSHVVRTVDYVTPDGREDYPRTADVRRAVFGSRPPATSTVVVKSLLRSGALIEIEALAARNLRVDSGLDELSQGSPVASARWAGDTLYLSTLGTGEARTEDPAGGPGVLQQSRRVYERARQVLVAAGLDLDHVVKVVEFLTPGARRQYSRVREIRETYLARRGVARTTVVMPRVMHPGALVQMEFVAAAGKGVVIDAEGRAARSEDRAAGVRIGRVLYVSGQRAVNSETRRLEHAGDIVGQARSAYANLATVLAAAGAGPEAIVRTTEFVTQAGLRDYRKTAEVRREVFKAPYPAATGIICEELIDAGALIEVEAVAVVEPRAG